MRWICVKLAKTLKIICVFVSQNRSNCLLNIMIIKKKSECNSIFFMILCIMVIVGGMARFSPALIYRRFIFETRSVGGVLPLTAYNTTTIQQIRNTAIFARCTRRYSTGLLVRCTRGYSTDLVRCTHDVRADIVRCTRGYSTDLVQCTRR